MNIQEWFKVARDREIPELLEMPYGFQLNLGEGRRPIGQAHALDLEHGWDADRDPIPYAPDSVAGIWAHAFFDYVERPIDVLLGCQRVLRPGGVLNIVGPHGLSDLWAEDVQRRNRWSEESWRNLLNNPWYDAQTRGPKLDRLDVHTTFIIGVAWRNLSLFTQLVKR